MKKIRLIICFVALTVLSCGTLTAQKTYHYKTYPNDPLNVREYTLDNGLKVFMSVYKDAPKIQTYIAVRAGSKNDPHETTGLAHYLEHMMFKGTERLGTTDWEKEKVLIQKIEDLFEAYRMFDDDQTRAAIYHKIDSLSYEASKIAVANEYDKAMSAIGSTGTNAFTSNDYTMYVENIPNNQLETWCEIEADRFQHLVLRLFHTELETIYEEKNMSLTKDGRKANDAMFNALFPHHPYGNQTTLGSQEHLKNPSMRNIRNFVATYYVPNNICISLAGDFNPDEAIKIIDKYWGQMQPGNVPEFKFEREQPINSVITRNVSGLDAENTIRAYRLDSGNGSHDALLAQLLESVLNNGKCGLIDLNINQQQKCLGAYAGCYILNDYGAFMFGGQPNQGQTLEQVQALFDEQIALVKQGKFDEWMLEAAINNMKLSIMKQAESNNSRASQMAYAYVEHRSWGDVCAEVDELSKITKKDLVAFANRMFKDNNYVVINKLQGEPEPILKVSKPPITPIEVGRDKESDFLKEIKARQVKPIEPVYVDFSKDMQKGKLINGNEILYVKNVENKTFNLIYRFDFGSRADKTIDLAADVLDYLSTSKHTAEQMQEEFYKLACNYSVSVGAENINVSISGLSENMTKAMALVEEIIGDCQPNEEAYQMMVGRILQSRENGKKNQQRCFSALANYGIYGADNPTTDILSANQLKGYSCKQLTDAMHNLFNYKHRVLYYGPEDLKDIQSLVNDHHSLAKKQAKNPKNKKFTPKPVTENTVYFVDYNANQTYMREYFRGEKFNTKNEAAMDIFNEYFGGSMNAIVFQEMREKRSLAYSAQSFYSTPSDKDGYFVNHAIIATQNDKLVDAMNAFNDLFDNMPVAEANFLLAKEAQINGIRTSRTTKLGIINSYLYYERMGFDTKSKKKGHAQQLFEAYPNVTMQDVINFNHKHIKGQKKVYMCLGKESDMNFDQLSKFGKVKKLTLEEIFGY